MSGTRRRCTHASAPIRGASPRNRFGTGPIHPGWPLSGRSTQTGESFMTQAEVADRVERYIRIQFRVAAGDARFSRTLPLFEAGYVDSVGVVELLTLISEEFTVELPDDALMSDQF